MRIFFTVLICFGVLCGIRMVVERLRRYLQHLSPHSPWQRRTDTVSRLVRAVATAYLFVVAVILVLQALE